MKLHHISRALRRSFRSLTDTRSVSQRISDLDLPASDEEAFERDRSAIDGDWKAVGDDMRTAMAEVRKHPPAGKS